MKRKRMSGLLAMTLAFSAVATPAVYAGTIDNAPTAKTAIVSKIAVDEISKKKIIIKDIVKGDYSVEAFVYTSEDDCKRILDEAIKERKSEIWVTTKKYYLMPQFTKLCSSRDYRSISHVRGEYKSNGGRDYDTFKITLDYSAFREETSVVLDWGKLEALEKSMVDALLESQYRAEDEFIVSVKNIPIEDFGFKSYAAKRTMEAIVGRSCEKDIRHENNSIRYEFVVRNDGIVDVVFKYDYSETSKEVIVATVKKEKEILDSLKSDMSDYEKVKIIYDEIIKSTEYFEGYTSEEYKKMKGHRSTTAVFGDKKATKDDYASAFQRLATLAGIESYDLGSWNLVKLGDNYYHLDVYNDDYKGKYKRYSYFLLSEEELLSKGKYVSTLHGMENEYAFLKRASEGKYLGKAPVKFNKTKVLQEEKRIREEKKAFGEKKDFDAKRVYEEWKAAEAKFLSESNSKVETQPKVEEKQQDTQKPERELSLVEKLALAEKNNNSNKNKEETKTQVAQTSINTKYGSHDYGCKTQAEYDAVMEKVEAAVSNGATLDKYTEMYLNGERASDYEEGTKNYRRLSAEDKTIGFLVKKTGVDEVREVLTAMQVFGNVYKGTTDPGDGTPDSAYDVLVRKVSDCDARAQLQSAVFDAMGMNTMVKGVNKHASFIVKIGGSWWHPGWSPTNTSGAHVSEPTFGN